MRTVPITLTEGQAKELETLAASRRQTPAHAIQVALALYAHTQDALRAGQQLLVVDREGVPLKQLTLRNERVPMRTVAITLRESHAREFTDLATARGQTPVRVLQFALAIYAHVSDALRAGQQVLVVDRDGVPLKRLTLRRETTNAH